MNNGTLYLILFIVSIFFYWLLSRTKTTPGNGRTKEKRVRDEVQASMLSKNNDPSHFPHWKSESGDKTRKNYHGYLDKHKADDKVRK